MWILKELKYQFRFGLPVFFIIFITGWLPDSSISVRFRGLMVSFFLVGRPKGLKIGRDVTLLSIHKIYLGDNVYIAKGSWLNGIGGITLEDEVVLAPYVVLSSNNHGFKNGSVMQGGAHPKPIKVGFGTWLAAHAVITAGASVGRGNLIAANSVVTRNSVDNVVMAGVPAKIIKTRIDNPSRVGSKHDVE